MIIQVQFLCKLQLTVFLLRESLKRELKKNVFNQIELEFVPRLKTLELLHHLNDKIDICLDNTMYTGGTTTNHALWMGVPVATLRGEKRAQGQSAFKSETQD